MKRTNFTTWKLGLPLLALVILLALTGVARAQHPGHGPGGDRPDREEMMNRMATRLGLSDEQQEQMKQIHEQQMEKTEALHEQMQAARQRVDEIADAEVFDEAALREAAAELSALQTEAIVSRAEMQQKVREILTPEQFEQLTQMREHGRDKMRHPGDDDMDGRPPHRGHKQAPQDG